eukprot:Awhi_evm1s15303
MLSVKATIFFSSACLFIISVSKSRVFAKKASCKVCNFWVCASPCFLAVSNSRLSVSLVLSNDLISWLCLIPSLSSVASRLIATISDVPFANTFVSWFKVFNSLFIAFVSVPFVVDVLSFGISIVVDVGIVIVSSESRSIAIVFDAPLVNVINF